jgi:hypothetical protein
MFCNINVNPLLRFFFSIGMFFSMAITQADLLGEDLGYDAGDPKQVRNKQREADFRELTDDGVLKNLMSTNAGRDWVWRMLSACHVFATSWVRGEADSTAYNEGQRSIGLQLMLAITRADPEGYILMQREHSHD